MQNEKPGIAAQYQTLIVIWAALLMSQLMFVVLIFLTKKELFNFDFSKPVGGQSTTMIVGFAVAAITVFVFSFAFRRRLNARAVEQQDTALVQTGLIIACALCEASSILGLALAFAFDYQYFFFWIAPGMLGVILHFPKRDQLHAACK